MKTLFVSFVAFLFAFIMGCQESPIDPVSNNQESSSTTEGEIYFDKDIIHAYPGVLNFKGNLFDPSHPPLKYAKTNAAIRFCIEPIPEMQDPPLAAIKVKLYVKAELKGGCFDRPWTVNKSSEDIIFVSPTGVTSNSFVKKFRVCNTCCLPLNLVLKLAVKEKEVTLVSIQLMTAQVRVQISDPIN